MSKPEVGEALGVVKNDRNIRGDVRHPVVDAGIPAQRSLQRHVPGPLDRTGEGARQLERDGAQSAGHVRVYGRGVAAEWDEGDDRRLSSENGRREHVAGRHKSEIRIGLQVRIQWLRFVVKFPVGTSLAKATPPPALSEV